MRLYKADTAMLMGNNQSYIMHRFCLGGPLVVVLSVLLAASMVLVAYFDRPRTNSNLI